MLNQLETLAQQQTIRALDYQFARFIYSLNNQPLLALCSALVSYELGQGNVCLSLSTFDPQQLFDLDAASTEKLIQSAGVETENWSSHLASMPQVGDGSSPTPLVLDQGRLYLYRYWNYEKSVANYLSQCASLAMDYQSIASILNRLFQRDYEFILRNCGDLSQSHLKPALIKWLDIEQDNPIDWEAIEGLFSASTSSDELHVLDNLIPEKYCLNWQKIAAALAATRQFSVISGGPGTGKTTTVTRLLALLIEEGSNQGRLPNIKLVAPTGKAAARLTESIGGALKALNCSEEVRNQIPAQAGTIHRLLGVIPDRPDFRHNKENPLHLDILVVDEASMVDLPLMYRLLEALPDHARLILLGDRDQLASVEAGSVLGDICSAADSGYSLDQTRKLEKLTGFQLNAFKENHEKNIAGDNLCLLRKSYRFDANSGIGKLAQSINAGNPRQAIRSFSSGFTDISLSSAENSGYASLIKLCVEGYQHYLSLVNDQAPDTAILDSFNEFQLLCALREGPYGVQGLNEEIRNALTRSGLITGDSVWYQGRPVLITRNDHGLGLYNGDIGITIRDSDGQLRVIFELPDKSIKRLRPSRLPEHETVFAMTVHKSQGSEFIHTVFVLPDQINPVITRELTYTGVTRAKQKLSLFASEKTLTQAINNPTMRKSGLEDRLKNL